MLSILAEILHQARIQIVLHLQLCVALTILISPSGRGIDTSLKDFRCTCSCGYLALAAYVLTARGAS